MAVSQLQESPNLNYYEIFGQTQLQRVSDGAMVSLLSGCETAKNILIVILPQLGDFDSLEYAWWLQRESKRLEDAGIIFRVVGIGEHHSGKKLAEYTQLPENCLFVASTAQLHMKLKLYPGLSLKLPGFSDSQNAWLNLLLMCAGIGSPGTLKEVFRGYLGDRNASQLINSNEVIHLKPLPPLRGSLFNLAGGEGFQRPFELATKRLRNMIEVLSHWQTYVPNGDYLTQRGATFLFDREGNLLYQYQSKGILNFAANMSDPLSFLESLPVF